MENIYIHSSPIRAATDVKGPPVGLIDPATENEILRVETGVPNKTRGDKASSSDPER